MSQSLSSVYIHATFGTKYRKHLLNDPVRPELHAYMSGILYNTRCQTTSINSVEDHVHILFRMSKTHSIAYVLEQVKKRSSSWLKVHKEGQPKFTWQRGYGTFSVSASGMKPVIKYIKNQKERHKTQSYQEELEYLFKKYGQTKYDPDQFWS